MTTLLPSSPHILPSSPYILTSGGHALDLSPGAFGPLRASSDIAHDVDALHVRMAEDGYLYLPGLLNRDEVRDARREICARVEAAGMLAPGTPAQDAIAYPDRDGAFQPDLAKRNGPLDTVLRAGPMLEFYARFLGGDVRPLDFTWLRTVAPGPGTNPHCDIVFMGRGTTNLYTAWTPLGDLDYAQGGLMMLEGSHKNERLRAGYGSKDVDAVCVNLGGRPEMGSHSFGHLSDNAPRLRTGLGGRWLTAEFRMGDMLTFSMFTVHASLDNQSEWVRLSSDTRYQLASEPADERWVGENPRGHGEHARRGVIC